MRESAIQAGWCTEAGEWLYKTWDPIKKELVAATRELLTAATMERIIIETRRTSRSRACCINFMPRIRPRRMRLQVSSRHGANRLAHHFGAVQGFQCYATFSVEYYDVRMDTWRASDCIEVVALLDCAFDCCLY